MSKPYSVKMPQLSDTMTEGVLVTWEKNVGDEINRGDIVATVETDKAIMDVEVFRAGYLSGPIVAVGETVPVAEAIAYIVESADDVVDSEITQNAAASQTGVADADTESVSQVDKQMTAANIESTGEKSSAENSVPEGVVTIIKMPQLSDTMTEGIVVSWDKGAGDAISRGDIVAQVETDKAIMDVEVFKDGYLSGPIAAADSVVPVGGLLAYIVETAAQVLDQSVTVVNSAPPVAAISAETSVSSNSTAIRSAQNNAGFSSVTSTAPAARPAGTKVTPFARKLASQLQVSLAQLNGTGPAGAITAEDVQNAQPGTRGTLHAHAEPVVPGDGRPMNAMEKAVSHSMTSALSMPTFNVTVNAQPGALIKAAKAKGVSVTVAIAKACALAIEKHPALNWAYQPTDRIVERSNIDIGMAVSADGGGLVVPILRDCQSQDLQQLGSAWKDLLGRARSRRLKPDEYANPTFMISNMGMLGVSYFDAIPTPGTCAILAISSAEKDGMPLTVTADHRVVNGAGVALFLNSLKSIIETPQDWIGSSGPVIPEGNWDYDVVVIGAGLGGEDCARDLVEQGLKVAMINNSPLPGGECLWRGCIPSKAWRASADKIRNRSTDKHLGIEGAEKVFVNWSLLEKTRRSILETRGEMALKTDKSVKIKFIQGYASFVNDHTVNIDESANLEDPHKRANNDNVKKGKQISFGCAVIATGAPPFVPPIPGVEEGLKKGSVLTSDTVWFLESAPKRVGVIGGGAIGLEMAQIFHDFGAKVTLLEAQERLLAEVETEIAKNLTGLLEKEPRLTINTSSMVKSIKGEPGSVKLNFQDGEGKARSFTCDYVILATGKKPAVAQMGLDKAGVEMANGVIKANKFCRTNVAHIFAVGDVIGGLMLAHTAGQQGRVAASSILGHQLAYDQDKDSGVIFTRPQAAFVGLSVAQAKEKGIDAVEVKVPMAIDAKAMIANETHGMIKIVADKKSHRIIGVHFLADHADTLIGEGVMMVAGGLTLEQVAEAIHPHPTQTEMFGDMARRLLSRLRRSKKIKA